MNGKEIGEIDYNKFKTYLKSKNKREDTIYNYISRMKELPQELIHKPEKLNYFIYHIWGKKPSVIDITTSAIRTYYKSIGRREGGNGLSLLKNLDGEVAKRKNIYQKSRLKGLEKYLHLH
jgi:hypothetical protein